MKGRPKHYTDEDGNEHNGSDIQDAYDKAQEDRFEREREEIIADDLERMTDERTVGLNSCRLNAE